jgi:hypothetical protein
MAEIRKQSYEPRDYKERFEFVLTTGGNIICQRYFKINSFNPTSLRSYELTSALRKCVSVIERDLKDKAHVYLDIYAPRVFSSEEEMKSYFANPEHCAGMTFGEGIVIRGNDKTDYFWGDKGPTAIGSKFDDGELTTSTVEATKTSYKLAFKVDGQEVSSIMWDGNYPKFMRDKIDLSNKKFRFENEDKNRLTLEQYTLYKMVEGKNDLVYGIIKTICAACSIQDNSKYTTSPDAIMEAWSNDSNKLMYGAF